MKTLSPLLGLKYDFRHYNTRFDYLSTLVMEKDLSSFINEFRDNDKMMDDYSNVTLLHMAVASGTDKTINYLIQQGLDVNTPDKEGNTPLHFAALSGCEKGVACLLALGAEKTIVNKRGQAPWRVARTGELLLALITEESKIKYPNLPKRSLYEAVEAEDLEATKLLLQLGVHPNLLNHEDHQVEFRLPLHIAVDKQNLTLAEILLEHGAKPSAPYLEIHVNLENAIKNRDIKMVELLLEHGADPNHPMRSSLLHLATDRNSLEILELLLQYGADPEVQVKGHYFYHPPLRDTRSKEAVQLLIQYGAKTDPDLMKDFLIWPIGRRDTDMVKEFIRIGVPVQNASLWSDAIRGSYHNQMIPICKVLLEAGLDINLPIKYFGTPLLRAVHYRNYELVKLFLDHGADFMVRSPEGYTPYELAISFLEKEISDLITSHMKQANIPIPSFQKPPVLSDTKFALQEDHADLIQISLYDSDGSPDHHVRFHKLMDVLGYATNALPFEVQNKEKAEEEYEEWDENYQAPLSDYEVIFHPKDPRCFLLLINWYDSFAYSTIYHLHVRCEKKYKEEISALFEKWFGPDEDDLAFMEHYKLGTYMYDWNQQQVTETETARLEEVEMFYLKAIEAIHKSNVAAN